MLTYHYQDSWIGRMEIDSPQRNILHARLIASDEATEAQLTDLRGFLNSRSLSTLMDVEDGHAVIEVRGLNNEKQLDTLLKQHGVTKGAAKAEGSLGPNHGGGSLKDKITDNALFLSALWYDLGNVAFLVSGYRRGKHNKSGKFTANDVSEMMIGAAFGVGDIAMTFCGKDRGDNELVAVEEALHKHLAEKGIQLPEGAALTPESLHKSGAAAEIYDWVSKHIVQIKCLTETTAGLFTIHSAMKSGERNNAKLAGGILITAGWLASFLTEKPSGHKIFHGNEPPDGLQESVLRNPRGWLAGPAAMTNNILTLIGANSERLRSLSEIASAHKTGNLAQIAYTQNKRNDYVANVVSACSFLVANSLFGLSGSKKPVADDEQTIMHDMVLLSANMLAKQPQELRDRAISETADVVSKLSHVSKSPQELEKMIHDKIEGLSHSSWVSRTQPTSPSADTPQSLVI